MVATFFHRGYSRDVNGLYMHNYDVLCDSGIAFQIREQSYVKSGTKLVIPDDWGMIDSGWISWQCDKDGLTYWTRTRPGGMVQCPMCNHQETCPDGTIMMPWEGADMADYYKELQDDD
jgi:hypothetical protein